MIYSDNTYDITNNIATYTRRDFKSVFDTTSNKWYMLNNLNNYEEYGIYGDSFDTYYQGKLVIVNDHEYEWDGAEWDDLGEATGEQRNVKFSEYFPDQASFTTKTINNVHWDMSRPGATSGNEDVYFSYNGPGTTSISPRFSMYYSGGAYTDTGFSDRRILQLPQDSDGYYYYNFGGEMYLSNEALAYNKYLNYTTWNYAYTFVDTIRYPKYYAEKTTPTISTLWASTIYRNSAHLTTLMRNDAEMAKMDYMSDDILNKGEALPDFPYEVTDFSKNGTSNTIPIYGLMIKVGYPVSGGYILRDLSFTTIQGATSSATDIVHINLIYLNGAYSDTRQSPVISNALISTLPTIEYNGENYYYYIFAVGNLYYNKYYIYSGNVGALEEENVKLITEIY